VLRRVFGGNQRYFFGTQRLTQNSVGKEWCYFNARKKRFRNTVPVCALLIKDFRNGVPLQKYTWF
jgi:hypothetical protein